LDEQNVGKTVKLGILVPILTEGSIDAAYFRHVVELYNGGQSPSWGVKYVPHLYNQLLADFGNFGILRDSMSAYIDGVTSNGKPYHLHKFRIGDDFYRILPFEAYGMWMGTKMNILPIVFLLKATDGATRNTLEYEKLFLFFLPLWRLLFYLLL